jgi:hypothetical protein
VDQRHNRYHSVFANNVGNAHADILEINEGKLVDEFVDVEQSVNFKSVLRVDGINIANAHTTSVLGITEGELLYEILDVSGNIDDSSVVINVKTMLLPCVYTKLVSCGLLRQCKSLAAQARSGRFRITPGCSYVRASAARWCI